MTRGREDVIAIRRHEEHWPHAAPTRLRPRLPIVDSWRSAVAPVLERSRAHVPADGTAARSTADSAQRRALEGEPTSLPPVADSPVRSGRSSPCGSPPRLRNSSSPRLILVGSAGLPDSGTVHLGPAAASPRSAPHARSLPPGLSPSSTFGRDPVRDIVTGGGIHCHLRRRERRAWPRPRRRPARPRAARDRAESPLRSVAAPYGCRSRPPPGAARRGSSEAGAAHVLDGRGAITGRATGRDRRVPRGTARRGPRRRADVRSAARARHRAPPRTPPAVPVLRTVRPTLGSSARRARRGSRARGWSIPGSFSSGRSSSADVVPPARPSAGDEVTSRATSAHSAGGSRTSSTAIVANS